MMKYDWLGTLNELNDEIFKCDELQSALPGSARLSRWLGLPPATETEIRCLETRLGTTLPPSYRQFLLLTNGWVQTNHIIDRLYSTHEVGWFKDMNKDLIDAWILGEDGNSVNTPDSEYYVYGSQQSSITMRSEYLVSVLQISEIQLGGTAVYLLNPRIIDSEGEWEAWLFAGWLPGADRYRSFWELMVAELKYFREHNARKVDDV